MKKAFWGIIASITILMGNLTAGIPDLTGVYFERGPDSYTRIKFGYNDIWVHGYSYTAYWTGNFYSTDLGSAVPFKNKSGSLYLAIEKDITLDGTRGWIELEIVSGKYQFKLMDVQGRNFAQIKQIADGYFNPVTSIEATHPVTGECLIKLDPRESTWEISYCNTDYFEERQLDIILYALAIAASPDLLDDVLATDDLIKVQNPIMSEPIDSLADWKYEFKEDLSLPVIDDSYFQNAYKAFQNYEKDYKDILLQFYGQVLTAEDAQFAKDYVDAMISESIEIIEKQISDGFDGVISTMISKALMKPWNDLFFKKTWKDFFSHKKLTLRQKVALIALATINHPSHYSMKAQSSE